MQGSEPQWRSNGCWAAGQAGAVHQEDSTPQAKLEQEGEEGGVVTGILTLSPAFRRQIPTAPLFLHFDIYFMII